MPALSAPGRIRRKSQLSARCGPGKKAKKTKRSARHASHDFLKQTFLPVSHFEGYRKNKTTLLEQQFFHSLSNLSIRYNLEPPATTDESFPFNILAAFQHTKKLFEKKQPGLELMITEFDGETTLSTVEEIGISYTLYLPPLSALDWLHARNERDNFQLLLSLYAYLNQSAGMPLPGDNDYLTSCYDAICDWLENCADEYEPVEWQEKKASITEMNRKQKILERAVSDPAQLTALNARVRSYKPRTEIEKNFHTVAKQIAALYKQYPTRNFFQNIHTEHLGENEDEYRGYPEHYFSFFWDDNGWLEESLMQYINGDLQECSRFEQPVAIQYFNHKDAKPYSCIDFEKRLLQLISELTSIIYKLTL
ncbi:MAG: hypothetical protein V4539_03110 [Bacteroidota bacterium]